MPRRAWAPPGAAVQTPSSACHQQSGCSFSVGPAGKHACLQRTVSEFILTFTIEAEWGPMLNEVFYVCLLPFTLTVS